MHLELKNIGKRYQNQWLFRHLNLELQSGDSLSVTGNNGSGKSSLMQVIYGLVHATEGEIKLNHKAEHSAHTFFSFTSPNMELPPEFSIKDLHQLYVHIGKSTISFEAFLEYSKFNKHQSEKAIKLFSSGMLQRLKTAFCLSSNAEIYMLDEPLSNMDKEGEIWYKNCISLIENKILIIAGNNYKEYETTKANIHLSN